MVISILVGIPAGIVAALYKNRWMDWWVMLVSMAGICIPAFVVAPLLGVALGMHVPGLSVAGWDSPGAWCCRADAGIGECRVPSAPDARRHA